MCTATRLRSDVPSSGKPAGRLIVATTELFAPGGVQRISRQAVAALASGRDGDLDVWSLCDHSIPSGYPVPANARFRLAGGNRWRLGRWAVGAAINRRSDAVVLVMHLHLAPLAIPLLASGARVALFLHGVEAWKPLSSAARFVAERARLIAISACTVDRFLDSNPRLGDRNIEVCPLGIDVETPAGVPDPAADVALTVSRLSSEDRYKGHDALIRAWSAVRARVPSARLVVVGDGDDRQRLEALAAELGLASAIRFLGVISDEELAAWYRRSAFFVLPSDGEGFGLVFLEAMRAGKACVSGPGAPAEIVQDGVGGFVVAPHDTARLVEVVARLFDNRDLRERLGANGRNRFLQSFTSDRFAARLCSLVSTLHTRERAA